MDCVSPINVAQWNNAVGSEKYYALMVNPPSHPSALHAPMPQYYILRDQRRIERVPRALYHSPPYETIRPITFSVNGWAGVRVKDVLKDTVVIDDPYDAVFAHHGWRAVVVNLEWPGYQIGSHSNPMNARIDVLPCDRHVTRADLAREVCALLFKFHQTASKYHIAPGWEKWSLTAGPEGVRVTDMVLLSLHYYRNIWVPELYVIE